MEDRDALQGPPECAFPAPRLEQNVYATAADPRGYLPVYEFLSSNGTPLMWDSEDGYVNWTSIRKAMGWSKKGEGRKLAIAKELEDVERTSPHVRRVRGGILKIQGTWIPKESALEAALTYCHPIRHELVPIFGPSFPSLVRDPATDPLPPRPPASPPKPPPRPPRPRTPSRPVSRTPSGRMRSSPASERDEWSALLGGEASYRRSPSRAGSHRAAESDTEDEHFPEDAAFPPPRPRDLPRSPRRRQIPLRIQTREPNEEVMELVSVAVALGSLRSPPGSPGRGLPAGFRLEGRCFAWCEVDGVGGYREVVGGEGAYE